VAIEPIATFTYIWDDDGSWYIRCFLPEKINEEFETPMRHFLSEVKWRSGGLSENEWTSH
jgi:hypothetical protein